MEELAITQEEYEYIKTEYEKLFQEDPGHEQREKWEEFMKKTKKVWENVTKKEQIGKVPRIKKGLLPSNAKTLVQLKASSPDTSKLSPEQSKEIEYEKQVKEQGNAFFKQFDSKELVVPLKKGVSVHKKIEKPVATLIKLPKNPLSYIPFGDRDLAWGYVFIEAAKYIPSMQHRQKYYIPPSPGQSYTFPLPEKDSVRIAIVGDIGTNDRHHTAVLEGIKLQNPDLVIHLGDVYVAGTHSECRKFWEVYTKVFPESCGVPLWSIPGNHEYISAGSGYFEELIKKGRLGGGKQATSFFCLESERLRLQILALDTGFNSPNFVFPIAGEQMDYSTKLEEPEKKWAQQKLEEAVAKRYRTIVLTHHQLVSSFWAKQFSACKLVEQLAEVKNNIIAWMWGHEHRLVVFDNIRVKSSDGKDIEIKNAHCVGHGAMPSLDGEYKIVPGNPHTFFDAYIPHQVPQYENTKVYNNGFVILEGNSKTQQLQTRYFQVHRVTGNTYETSQGVPRVLHAIPKSNL